MIKTLIIKKEFIKCNLKIYVRKKAIKNFKDKLELIQKKISDYSKEEIETHVAKEEKKIINSYKNKSIVALLAFLGISIF